MARTRKRKRQTQEVEELDPKALATMVNKRFGEGTMRFANDSYFDITRIPTGVLSVDLALGGGFPRGRHVEIYGPYAVGKTYLTYRTIASAQQMGLDCAFIDVENTFDGAFAESAGVNPKKLAVHRQEHGNRVIDFMETLLRGGSFGVIVLDSIASLLPKSELDADMEAGSYGTAQAKLMSAALRRLTAANESTVLIYLNQLRDAIGIVFGKKSVTSGGRAMSFYASTRLEMSRIETIKRKSQVTDPKSGDKVKKDLVVGHRVLVRVDKDKSGGALTGHTTSFVFDYEQGGIDHVEDLIYLGRERELVCKRGDNWWVDGYEDEKQNGRRRFVAWLKKNRAVQEDLEQRIKEPADAEVP